MSFIDSVHPRHATFAQLYNKCSAYGTQFCIGQPEQNVPMKAVSFKLANREQSKDIWIYAGNRVSEGG